MKKRFFIIFISLVLAVTFVTAFSVFGKAPRRAQVYGAIYGGDGTVATRNLNIAPINNTVFGVYSPSDTYELCTNLYFYILTDTTSIESFRIRLRLLSTAYELRNQSSQVSANKQLINMVASSGAISGYINIKNTTSVSLSVDSDGYSVLEYTYFGSSVERNAIALTIVFQNFMISSTPMYWEFLEFSINGEETALSYTDQMLNQIWDYDSQGGSSDTEGASEMVETIAGDVSNINNTIQSHTPQVQNWFETSPVATDLVNIALLANSWLPAYLNCDPDVSFYWGLVTFCILLTLIENGLRRRPWHGFDDGGDFESEYDVTSTDEKGRSRTIHNKVSGSRRRIR